MKKNIWILTLMAFSLAADAQYSFGSYHERPVAPINLIPKLYQRNSGIILGLEKGKSTFIELGGEMHWRKVSLRNPRITGATASMEYNFSNHVIGYKAGGWMKQGRINFTYGANLVYFTDFNGMNRYGINPAIGFRLAGFHLINGFNILTGDTGDKEMAGPNTLYLSLRYYFPLRNKFIWDRREQEKRKKQRERDKQKKQDEEKDTEKKGLRKLLEF